RVGLVAPAVAEPAEVAAFAELRPLIGHLPDHPLLDLVSAAQVPRPEAADLLGEIEEDGAGLEHDDRFAAALRIMVHEHRHAGGGVHLEEGVGELIAPADVAGHDPVGKAELLEEDRDLLAVRRRPVMDVKHWQLSFGY